MIVLHCHILPGIGDRPASEEETLARRSADAGFSQDRTHSLTHTVPDSVLTGEAIPPTPPMPTAWP